MTYSWLGSGFLLSRIVSGTLLRMEENDVHLGAKEEAQGHGGADSYTHAQAGQLHLYVICVCVFTIYRPHAV